MYSNRNGSRRRIRIAAPAIALWLATDCPVLAQQQPTNETPPRNIILGSRGGPVSDTQLGITRDRSIFDFSASVGVTTDYIYRGVTLSDRKPALGASFEAAFDKLYVSLTAASVKLPTDPSAEISFAAGLRPKLGNIEFGFAWTYYAYPNESWWLLGPTGGTDYWETSLRAETQVTNVLRVGGGFAWSPNISNTGAPGQYYFAGASYDLSRILPSGINILIAGSVGYSRFGNMDALLGGFPLPSYTNWNAGATFTYRTVSFDLRYYDTNLSEERCYVFTGATDAVAGGAIDPLRNPEGLRSRWCGATFVAKLVFTTN